MPCPTCDHSMQLTAEVDLTRADGMSFPRIYHCSRCGTQKVEWATATMIHVPKLVERCREYGKGLAEAGTDAAPYLHDNWQRFGIAEAIHKPEDRP